MRADRRLRAAALSLSIFAAACNGKGGAPVRVTIPPGAGLRSVSDSLARTGVIGSPKFFRMYASFRKSDRSIKAGTYVFHKGEGWNTVLEQLRGGKGIVHVVTIPEGFSLYQIQPLLASKLAVPPESIDVAARDTALLHELDIPTPTLEGYLFPDTYVFAEGTTARAAVDVMVKKFQQVWKPEYTARLDTLHMTRNDVMSLAAIVEKEARLPQERPVIAAVYMNRLKRGMLLQADPTVQYALGKHVARVFYKDLEVASPYNTYKHKGLPPGPIASPGRPSIEAALYPANVPYVFFVAFPDGHHEFRRDLAGHEQAKAEARRAWDSVDVVRRPEVSRPK